LKLRIGFLLFFIFCLAFAPPALAGTAYDNGPANGNTDGWNIGSDFVVSDSMRCCKVSGDSPAAFGIITSFSAWFWETPGDHLLSAELSITSGPDSGTSYFDHVMNFTQGSCFSNQYGFSVCQETTIFTGQYSLYLSGGNYWINLQNAITADGEPIYWDENSGAGCNSPGCPSSAVQNMVGTIPSESFTLEDTGGGSTPEPGGLVLFGSGVVALAGGLRRKMTL